MSNKVLIEAPLILRKLKNHQVKEIASKLSLPDNNQDDLLFMSAILVSTGTNKNGATFLGSELIKAKDSIKQKALDIEHEEHKIIGHIAETMFMDFNGNLIDDEALYQELEVAEESEPIINKLDKLQIDIGIVCIVYKDRFPQIAKEIEAGEWKVSMECYYDDYDLKIGNLIIPRLLVANKVEVNSVLDKEVKLVMSGKSLGTSQVSRVLRNVRFCGVGIVKNPANERSIILEAAKVNLQETIDREGFSACLKEAATLNLGDETSVFELPTRLKNEVVQVEASGYFIIKLGEAHPETVTDSFSYEYSEVAKKVIKLSSLDKSNKYVIVSSNSLFMPRESVTLDATSDAVAYSTDSDGKVVEIHSLGSANRETSYLVSKFGPKEQPAGICISFEKYVREFPGSPNPGRIVNTHWCKLFNKPCPVLGADAQDKDCLRSKFSRLVKDENIHGNALAPLSFNPTIDPRDTELINLDSPPSLGDSLKNKPVEGEPVADSLLKTQQSPAQTTLPIKESIEVIDSEVIPATPLPTYPAITKINPILDFPVQLASISLNERKLLKDSDFALPELKKYPINTENSVQSIISIFPYLIKTLSYREQRSLFKNTLLAALRLGLDTYFFENKSKSLGFQLKPGLDYSEEYGIPRLKLFPLDSKEQVISAMSRFATLKADITDHERQHLIVNILLAAKRFNIDSSKFCDRVKKGTN